MIYNAFAMKCCQTRRNQRRYRILLELAFCSHRRLSNFRYLRFFSPKIFSKFFHDFNGKTDVSLYQKHVYYYFLVLTLYKHCDEYSETLEEIPYKNAVRSQLKGYSKMTLLTPEDV